MASASEMTFADSLQLVLEAFHAGPEPWLAECLATVRSQLAMDTERCLPAATALPALFACVGHQSADIRQLAIAALRTCLGALSLVEIFPRVQDYFGHGLRHPDPAVGEFALEQLLRLAETSQGLGALTASHLLHTVAALLAPPPPPAVPPVPAPLSHVALVARLLVQVARDHAAAPSRVLRDGLLPPFATRQVDAEVELRVLDALADAAGVSPDALRAVDETTHLFARLLLLLWTHDTLVVLNAVEIVGKLAASAAGFDGLLVHGHVAVVLAWLAPHTADGHPVGGPALTVPAGAVAHTRFDPLTRALLLPSALSFVAHHASQVAITAFQSVTPVLEHLFALLATATEENDTPLATAVLDCIAALAQAPAGLALLAASAPRLAAQLVALSRPGVFGGAGKPTFFGVLAALLAPRGLDAVAAPQHIIMEAVAYAWGGETAVAGAVLAAARQPFEDYSLAGLASIEALALSPWGRKTLCTQRRLLFDTVTDRRTNATPAHLRWKVSIAAALFGDAMALGLETAEVENLQAFVDAGRRSVGREPLVAVESVSL